MLIQCWINVGQHLFLDGFQTMYQCQIRMLILSHSDAASPSEIDTEMTIH